MKDIEWSELYGVGDIVSVCDTCGAVERFEFEDNNPDFREAQNELNKLGWLPCKVNGQWHDFCCEE